MSIFCEISAKFEPHGATAVQVQEQRHGNMWARLAQIRQSFVRLEFRLLKEPISQAIHSYIKNPVSRI